MTAKPGEPARAPTPGSTAALQEMNRWLLESLDLVASLVTFWAVRYAAALALHRLGERSDAVVRGLAEVVAEYGPEEIAGLPPWDEIYPDRLDVVLELDPDEAGPAVRLLLERLPDLDKIAARDAVEVLLRFADDELRRKTVDALVANDGAWERAIDYEHLLPEHGLPPTRAELRGWLAG